MMDASVTTALFEFAANYRRDGILLLISEVRSVEDGGKRRHGENSCKNGEDAILPDAEEPRCIDSGFQTRQRHSPLFDNCTILGGNYELLAFKQ